MSLDLNPARLTPLQEALIERCDGRWVTREELVRDLSDFANAELVEWAIGMLISRRLLESLAVSSIASGSTTYHATAHGHRTLRAHRRPAAPSRERRRGGLRLV